MIESQTSIHFVRLVTGEDLIAETLMVDADDVEDSHFVLYNPLKVLYFYDQESKNPDPHERLTISLIEWVLPIIVKDQEFKIYESDIITYGTPHPRLVSHYQQYFTEKDAEELKAEHNVPPISNNPDIVEKEDLTNQEGLVLLETLLASRKGKESGGEVA